MARRAIVVVAMLALVAGCGDATPPSLTEQALKALRGGRYAEAIATCGQAIGENPQDAEAFLYRGRAYQFRNAMGDPQRAIADFTAAIQLAPRSSDAYYSRAIVYRDLGQLELARADDKRARAADDQLHHVYQLLPDPLETTTAAEPRGEETTEPEPDAPQVAGDPLPKSEDGQRELYKQLKERFEPGLANSEDTSARESPLERYKKRRAKKRDDKPAPEDSLWGDLGALPSPTPTMPNAGPPAPRLPEEKSAVPRRGRSGAPSSPFQPRVTYGASEDRAAPVESAFGRPLQSPFGQRAPAPTGFGAQPGGASNQPLAAPAGEQRSSNNDLYTNPLVRPLYPRDYVP